MTQCSLYDSFFSFVDFAPAISASSFSSDSFQGRTLMFKKHKSKRHAVCHSAYLSLYLRCNLCCSHCSGSKVIHQSCSVILTALTKSSVCILAYDTDPLRCALILNAYPIFVDHLSSAKS